MSTIRPGSLDADDRPFDTESDSKSVPMTEFSPAMDPAVKNIQPGGGVVMSLELAWGRLRRWYLRRFRSGYVQRMAACRHGHSGSIPLDPVDSRDVKFYRNQDTYWWADQDDSFGWRESLPFVRVGLAELIVIGGGFLLLAGLFALLGTPWSLLSIPMLVLVGLIGWFFRDPSRNIPPDIGTVVSPADGKLVQIDRVEDPELGPCVQFGIFLSIFNVHANRASLPGKVMAIRYRPGKMLNALRPESTKENENLDVILLSNEPDQRLYRIRQITGQFARRIVCWIRPGDILERGEMYGMIKLGSRTELLVPDSECLEIVANVGDKVSAGSTIFACYRPNAFADTRTSSH
jgi:phosphatidylserine decarboxylase